MSKKSAEITNRNSDNVQLIENRTNRVLAQKKQNIRKLEKQVKENDEAEIIL